ncbi:hypothetical protein [Mycetohabitans endofungorum]|uniref:hypothetical protein n=1 Tax=Mycetohabitans endofungorum TaxID=417203 RepID=UPI002B058D4C|nr:hypothetical protein [Mycetohabitans endofungorum]
MDNLILDNLNRVPAAVRRQIHFDTLLETASQVLATYAGKSWSDKAEHDPGITLLQALAYGVSDLAYRHTHPLVDLLTPATSGSQARQAQGVFPKTFGPQWALTCTPITAEDYRRALLDLHSDKESDPFYFRNIQLVCESAEQYYTYWYNVKTRQFQFSNRDAAQKLHLLGGYQIFVEPSRNANLVQAQEALDKFLIENRNICEQVRTITWLKPQPVNVQVEVDLADDCQDYERVMADIYTLVDDWISPKPARSASDVLIAEGWSTDDIYDGPYLNHGWITALPPAVDYRNKQTVDISGLVCHLLNVRGIVRIRTLHCGQNTGWTQDIPAQHYPMAWGEQPIEILAGKDSPVKLFKRGQHLLPEIKNIRRYVKAPKLIDDVLPMLPMGRDRNVGQALSVSALLPSCYGLQDALEDATLTIDETLQRENLRQFLQLFEDCLTTERQQLATLPQRLAFNRDHQKVGEQEQAYKKELETIDALLRYFGGQVASPVLSSKGLLDSDFLKTQQNYLSQFCDLTYHRAKVRIDKTFPLLKRIAARLGIESNDPQLTNKIDSQSAKSDIYLVEYRALLPQAPNTDFVNQIPTDVDVNDSGSLKLFFAKIDAECLPQAGQLIQLKGAQVNINWALVTQADKSQKFIELDAKQNAHLKRNAERIKKNLSSVQCSYCDVWLHDMDFRLEYADDQNGLDDNKRQKRIQITLSPTVLKAGNDIIVESAKIIASREKGSDASISDVPLHATIRSIDVAKGCFIAELQDQQATWPDTPSSYLWYIPKDTIEDQFSFGVGIVFNRDQLLNVARPGDVIAWVEQIVREEIPCHIATNIHWLDNNEFKQFSQNYQAWQNNGVPLGQKSYTLLRQLALGRLPDEPEGIGTMHIITREELADATLVDPATHEWKTEENVKQAEVLYVPKLKDCFGNGKRLTASDGAATDQFGFSVAVSGDGQTLVVGAVTIMYQTGSAYVFVKENETWTEKQKLTASDGAAWHQFGSSVAISGDGQTLVVGACTSCGNGGAQTGSVYVFVKEDGIWIEKQKLVASDGAVSDYFGIKVAISGDGQMLVVGASHNGVGSAYVFMKEGGTWTEKQKLKFSDGTGSVAVSGDGQMLVAGSYNSPYVFMKEDGAWIEKQKLTASDGAACDQFGFSVAVSGDGQTLVVGAPYNNNGGARTGSAYVFVKENGTWKEKQKLTALVETAVDCFGASVAVSDDGETLFVGAHSNSNNKFAAAYVFMKEEKGWKQKQKLTALEGEVGFGVDGAISGDGQILLVGAENYPGVGKAYIYESSV